MFAISILNWLAMRSRWLLRWCENAVERLDMNEWAIIGVGIIAVGFLTMKGFSSNERL